MKRIGTSNFFTALAWLLLGVLLVFIGQNRHSKADRFNYHSEIWSDKAGYFIYLAAFEYDWDANLLPDSTLISKTGNGFSADAESGAFLTKYTYGTALAYAPFYFIGRFFESKTEEYPGFSVLQNRMISLAAALWLLAGLYFLSKFLSHYYPRKHVIITLALVLLGTNLLYYGVQETGMSHVYSFTVFAVFLYFIKRRNFLESEKWWEFLILGALVGWIAVLRQSNLVFPLVFFLLDTFSFSEIRLRFQRVFRPKNLVPAALGFAILLAPQLLYWNYAYGSLITYSYGEEGFLWTNPRMAKLLFSPYNGLFLYAPALLIIIPSSIAMFRISSWNGVLILGKFLFLTYLFSCWWEWNFGCAFGARSYVEYLPLFSLAIAFGVQWISKSKTPIKQVLILLLVLCCVYTMKMTFSVEGCFPGNKQWDWPVYWQELSKPLH